MVESNFFNVTYCFLLALKIRAIKMANPMTARTADIFSGIKKESEIVQTILNKLYVDDKVSKGAKVRNRYNQVPHLTQDTNGKVTNSQLDTTNESKSIIRYQVTKGIKPG